MSRSRRLSLILGWCATGLVLVLITTLGFALYLSSLARTLPDLDATKVGLETPRTSVVYAADGSVLAEWHGEQDRTVVPFDSIPMHLRNAVVAIEDQRFYEHKGVDSEAILRALKVNAETQQVEQGGSTITQQLVKILFTKGERTLTRKLKEALLANQLEQKIDKDHVLGTYLNTVYFGSGAYGAESASRHYFGRPVSSLTLPEAALLAGTIQSPSRFDPIYHPEDSKRRRDVVLDKMAEQGYITPRQARQAKEAPIGINPREDVRQTAPYFVEYVKRDLIDRLGSKAVFGGGLRVYTTLDPAIQEAAEKSAARLSAEADPEVAIVTVRPSDGRVLAMVGGRDFAKNQFNLAAQGRRQPGSAFKPFVLVTALEKGVGPQQVFEATPYSVPVKDGVWQVDNYENRKTKPRITLQAATNWSVNAVYARLIMQVGAKNVVKTARRMGITTPLDPDPAIALGGLKRGVSPLEMASAYGTLANEGVHAVPTGILRVTDDAGKPVYEPKTKPTRALDRAVAVQASLMLHEVVEQGTATKAKFGKWAAGKTGTTQSYRDAWFVGWSGDMATAVWVGYPQAQIAMTNVHGDKVTGGSIPAEIWSAYMKQATKVRSAPVTPAGDASTSVVMVRICRDSMLLANQKCPRTIDLYLATELVPQETCTLH